MRKKSDERILLTLEEARFIDGLIERNRSVLGNIIKFSLGEDFDHLWEDCLSETYLLACRKIDVLKAHENPDGWIINAAKKNAGNMKRNNNKYKSNISIEKLPELPDEQNVFEEAVFNIWMEKKVPSILISRLSKREKEVYELFYIEHKTTDEIAKRLGINVSTVRNIKKNIVDKIKYDIKQKNF